MNDDRTVHARLRDGREVVRYDRAGKWYVEHPGGGRRALSVGAAARLAISGAGEIFYDRPGGWMFNRIIRRLA